MEFKFEVDLAHFKRFMTDFVDPLNNKRQKEVCPRAVMGFLCNAMKKNMQQMSYKMGDKRCKKVVNKRYRKLRHFFTYGKFDDRPLWNVLARFANMILGGPDAYAISDDSAFMCAKQSTKIPGVSVKYAGAIGRSGNCQSVVTLTLTRDTHPVLLKAGLLLPKVWTDDPDRMDEAGVPKEYQVHRSKPEIALGQIRWAVEQGVNFGCVLADAEYVRDKFYRAGLEELGLTYTGGIACNQLVYSADVEWFMPSQTRRGRKHKSKVPSCKPVNARACFQPDYNGKIITRHPKSKGTVKCEYRFVRIRMADGEPVSIPDAGRFNSPSETELWLIEERRYKENGDFTCKYHVSNRPADVSLKLLVRDVKERWRCETTHQQMKEELGADHFEGRTWTGFHRYLLFSAIAFVYLQFVRAENGQFECEQLETDIWEEGEEVTSSEEVPGNSTAGVAMNAGNLQKEPHNPVQKLKMTLPQLKELIADEIESLLSPNTQCSNCNRRRQLKLMKLQI